jgi:Abortive infection C-terminus
MELAGIEGQLPPGLNKVDKTRAWLRLANENCSDPLKALGIVLAEFMEVDSTGYPLGFDLSEGREKINRALASCGLSYVKGGLIISAASATVGKTLQYIIDARDLSGLQTEFDRIYKNVESDPASAVTASCALLESLFRTYIEEEKLDMPSDKSIRALWKVIRADLKLDPAALQDEDLRTALTGLAAIVEGIGALRTHKGSAHGHAKTVYKLKPRHARLAAHASFTLASFVLEAWSERGFS